MSNCEQMRILVIPTTDWIRHPVPNRLNFVFDILAEKHDVYVCHFKLKKFEKSPERETNCILEDMGGFMANDPSVYYMSNIFTHLSRLKELVEKHDIEVILSANILPSYMATFLDVKKVPIVYDYMDYYEESAAIYYPNQLLSKIVKGVTGFFVNRNLRKSAAVITITKAFEDFLKPRGVDNVEIISNGVDTSCMIPINGTAAKKEIKIEGTVLGYVGSLEHWIDLETVIQALPNIIPKIPDIKLLIVGPSLFTDYADKLNDLAVKLNIKDRIVFSGQVKYSEVHRYISAMDICLNPRKPLNMNIMTLGGKVFNYLACGRPILSSNMPILEDMFNHNDGFFYYDGVDDFTEKVISISNKEHDVSKYREQAMNYDWRILTKSYEDVLLSVLNKDVN